MSLMRAILVLATILSFAIPKVSWTLRDSSPIAAASMSLAAPAAAAQLVRAIVKTDKAFGFDFALAPPSLALFPPIGSFDRGFAGTDDAPNLDLAGPPLAPRPPPLV
jgi:hypothetical protein